MPNLSFLHVSLNLDTPEGREIHENLARTPERQRSRVVRTALLAFFRGASDGEKRVRKTKATVPEPEPSKRILPAAPTVTIDKKEPAEMSEKDGQEQSSLTKANAEKRVKGLLNLIQ
jgi:hypothetical protein